MADGTTCEREVCISEDRDDADTVDAIYVWYNLYKGLVEGISSPTVVFTYPLQSQVPILIHKGLVSNCKQRDMPRLDTRRRWVYGEQFNVQRIKIV
jgi:hypothetical protein